MQVHVETRCGSRAGGNGKRKTTTSRLHGDQTTQQHSSQKVYGSPAEPLTLNSVYGGPEKPVPIGREHGYCALQRQ
ncbi:Hypp8105 [Branchiostoma lanceolatum]|uniref:Hypp8105 protein n=1 Tax=Branchiostoma lanceolatum TaxID=7740 RepID=A0A8K0EH71_BRALA|nr:Hypp8105 [Branchiostoma lanceolatum]